MTLQAFPATQSFDFSSTDAQNFSYALGGGKWIRTGRGNPCVICGDTKKDCATVDNSSIVLCKSGVLEANGYRRLRQTSEFWFSYAPINDESWRNNLKQRDVTNAKIEIVKRRSTDDRDAAYRAMPAALSFSRRQNLLNRGLTKDEIAFAIDQRWIFDVNKGGLWNGSPGFAIASISFDGRIQGIQIAKDDRSPKYAWDSKDGSARLDGLEETPFAYFEHPRCDRSKPVMIVATDAFLKPLVAGLKYWRAGDYQTIFIGSPGGNYGIQQLTQLLGSLTVESVTYAPDAGDALNLHMRSSIEKFAEICAHAGHEVKLSWWGQFTKEKSCDLDELQGHEAIKLISIDQFLAFGDRSVSIKKRDEGFKAVWGLLQKDFRIVKPSDNAIEYSGYASDCEDFLGYADTTYLQGWLGAGKTQAILERIKANYEGKVVLLLTSRNLLLRQMAERGNALGLECVHFQDNVMLKARLEGAGTENREGKPALVIMAAIDSLKEYHTGKVDWSKMVVVIDEFSGCRKEILHKAELPQFNRMLSECGNLIVADAFLSSIDLAVIRQFRPEAEKWAELVHQKFEQSQKPINWIESRNDEGQISYSHDGVYLGLLEQWADELLAGTSKRIAIATDTLLAANICNEFLLSAGISTWVVSSETPEENSSFMLKPDGFLESDTQPIQALIYTPSAQSGMDVQTPFDKGLLICAGVLNPTQMLQMLGRCRQCSEWFVSAPRRSLDPAIQTPRLDAKSIAEATAKIEAAFAELEYQSAEKTQGWAVWEGLVREVEKTFNSEYIYALLNHYFANVTTVELAAEHTPEWRAQIKTVKDAEAEGILRADLTRGQHLINNDKAPVFNSDVPAVKAAVFQDKYPDIYDLCVSQLDTASQEDAIALTRTMRSGRTEKKLNYVIATQGTDEDIRELEESFKGKPGHHNSRALQRLRAIQLHRLLNLEGLAQLSSSDKKEVNNVNVFTWQSDAISDRFKAFQDSAKLRQLFPLVANQWDFFVAVKWAMRQLGYQGNSKLIRVQTEDKRNNGYFPNGTVRYAFSKVTYFVGWLSMDCAGSKFEQENFGLIHEALYARMVKEREERKARKEKAQTE